MCHVHVKVQWFAVNNLWGVQETTSVRSLISTDNQERILDTKYLSRKLPFPPCSGPSILQLPHYPQLSALSPNSTSVEKCMDNLGHIH